MRCGSTDRTTPRVAVAVPAKQSAFQPEAGAALGTALPILSSVPDLGRKVAAGSPLISFVSRNADSFHEGRICFTRGSICFTRPRFLSRRPDSFHEGGDLFHVQPPLSERNKSARGRAIQVPA